MWQEQYNHQWAGTDLAANHQRLSGDQSIAEILRYLAVVQSRLLLDIGCGLGRTLVCWQHHGYRAVGMDFALAGLRRYRRVAPGAWLVCASAAALPFRAGVFDVVLVMGVLYELSVSEAAKMTRELRLLTTRVIYVSQYPKDLWKTVLRWLYGRRLGRRVLSNRQTLQLWRGWQCERVVPLNHYFGVAQWGWDLLYRPARSMDFTTDVDPQQVRWLGRMIARFAQRWWPMLCAGLVYFQFRRV